MAALCGVLGDCRRDVAARMAEALQHRGPLTVGNSGEAHVILSTGAIVAGPCALHGAPRGLKGEPLDASAVLELCRQAHPPCSMPLRGAFAAVVAGRTPGAWWLLRDRTGRVPLYYAVVDGVLLFATELRAVLASGLIRSRLNLTAVDQYMTLGCVPGAHTAVKGIHRVEPGRALVYDHGAVSTFRFAGFGAEDDRIEKEDAVRRLRELMEEAQGRVEADTLLWSSGLDCAALAGLNPRMQPLHVVVDRAWQDETRLAKETARRMDRTLSIATARRLTETEFMRITRALDEPVANASVLPLGLVLQAASAKTPVAATGHGADQLFGGFTRFRFVQKTIQAQAMVPATFVGNVLPSLPPNAFVRRGGQFLANIRDNLASYLSLTSVFDGEERAELYTEAVQSALHDAPLEGGLGPLFQDDDFTRNVFDFDLAVGLPNVLLHTCDRLSAAFGMRLELPYLDDAILDFAVSLPPHVKYGVRSKTLLRQAMKGALPGRVRLRARRDFRVPQGGRVQRVVDAAARDLITPDRVDATGLFRWSVVETVMRRAGHNVYRQRQFWALLLFFAWHKHLLEG